MVKEITPNQANEILKQEKDAVLVDVRSSMEYEYVGHPLNAVHLPIKEPPDWETDLGFVEKVRSKFQNELTENPDRSFLMLCRSGVRSGLAAEMLVKEGFTSVYNVLEGFEGDKDDNGHRNTINGWRFHNLPWEQS
ncbi:MAG: rhodanese-like domain-containing protein [Pseudomonadota bacterium]